MWQQHNILKIVKYKSSSSSWSAKSEVHSNLAYGAGNNRRTNQIPQYQVGTEAVEQGSDADANSGMGSGPANSAMANSDM